MTLIPTILLSFSTKCHKLLFCCSVVSLTFKLQFYFSPIYPKTGMWKYFGMLMANIASVYLSNVSIAQITREAARSMMCSLIDQNFLTKGLLVKRTQIML